MPSGLIDYNNGTGGNLGTNLFLWGYPPTNNEAEYNCQTFTASKSYTLTSVKLWFQNVGCYNPPINTGTATVAITATDGNGKPTGDDLCSSTFGGNRAAWLALGLEEIDHETPIVDTVEIELSMSYSIIKDTKYAIVVRAPDAPGEEQELVWRVGSSSGYSGGQFGYYNSDADFPNCVWYMTSGDGWFETYGTYTLAKAINPTPAHNATNVTLHQETITWENGGGATAYDVYYGLTSGSLVKVSSAQAGTSFTVKGATNGSPYGYVISRSWRIDSIGSDTVTGDVWTFTTITFDPVLPTGITIVVTDGVPAATGTATGENNIVTIKKLVAVTGNNDLWYEAI